MDDELLFTGENQKKPIFNFATIGAVYTDGVSLIFDGQTTATAKRYRTNAAVTFSAGQRVKVFRDSGTYIVEYPIS